MNGWMNEWIYSWTTAILAECNAAIYNIDVLERQAFAIRNPNDEFDVLHLSLIDSCRERRVHDFLRQPQFRNAFCTSTCFHRSPSDCFVKLSDFQVHRRLVHNCVYCNYQLPAVFANYFSLNNEFHQYFTRSSNHLHLPRVNTPYGSKYQI